LEEEPDSDSKEDLEVKEDSIKEVNKDNKDNQEGIELTPSVLVEEDLEE
jgi:hypothetical protein